jgi:hypothetical protein
MADPGTTLDRDQRRRQTADRQPDSQQMTDSTMTSRSKKPEPLHIEYSEALGMKYKYRRGLGVKTEDGVRYLPREIEFLKKSGGITKSIHLVKKVFEGEILK